MAGRHSRLHSCGLQRASVRGTLASRRVKGTRKGLLGEGGIWVTFMTP